ncbi:MAG: hypothetical protein IPG01_15760 [Chitinophagaceae bacterium]|nr:hypothetical protein [Chitinophagaceae bacterium]
MANSILPEQQFQPTLITQKFNGEGDDNYITTYYNQDGSATENPFIYHSLSPGTIDIMSAKVDFASPLKKNGISKLA